MSRAFWAGRRGTDLRNLGLIVAGGVALLLILPPQHEYPIIDDWIYARSVRDQLATGAFHMPAQSQASLVGLTLWGTAWARLFGLSYTTLTWSTLVLALVALLAGYGLARACGVPPGGALLGAALLGINPIFLHLSYSFMTDVPFLALVLVACFGYMRGLQGHGDAWLWGAGLAAGYGVLIRQFALLVPLAFLGYLGLRWLLLREGSWRQVLGVAVVPALIVAAWWVWSQGIPPSGADLSAASRRAVFLFKAGWPRVFYLRVVAVLPLTALAAWAAVTLRPARWWLLGVALAVVAGGWLLADAPGGPRIATTDPPATLAVGPLALTLPDQIDPFVEYGNILRVGGIDFFESHQAPIWTPAIWAALFLFATTLGVLLLAKTGDAFLDWLRFRRGGPILTPRAGVYLAGLAICGAELALGADFYDRYLLGFVAFAILFVVRGARAWGRLAWGYSLAALILLAGFGLLLQADAADHDNARWQAADWMLARVGRVHAGYDWDNVRGYGDGRYEVADVPLPGFRIEARFPYTSRLDGVTTRYVLAQARADLPALPPPAPLPPGFGQPPLDPGR